MRTIREIEVELRNNSIVIILISIYLFSNIQWTVANLTVELHSAGAWNPWLVLGIVWYVGLFSDMVVTAYDLYITKTDELARLIVG